MMFGWLSRYRESGKVRCATGVCQKNLHAVVPGKIYRSAAPEDTEAAYRLVMGLALRLVLDLRDKPDLKERDWVDSTGARYVTVPMPDNKPITPAQFDTALDWLKLPDLQPVLVHCQGGRHRTGAVIAAYRVLVQGWTIADAWAEACLPENGYYRAWGHGAVEDSWRAYLALKGVKS